MFTVISKDSCPWCDKAKELLTEKGEDFTCIALDVDIGVVKTLKTIVKMAGFTTVPQVFDPEGNLIGGYEELKEYLNV